MLTWPNIRIDPKKASKCIGQLPLASNSFTISLEKDVKKHGFQWILLSIQIASFTKE